MADRLLTSTETCQILYRIGFPSSTATEHIYLAPNNYRFRMRAVSVIFVTVALISALLPSADAISRLHRGPSAGGAPVVLRGQTITDIDENIEIPKGKSADTGFPNRHLVDFYIHLDKDVVVWNELSDDNISMDCETPIGIIRQNPPDITTSRGLNAAERQNGRGNLYSVVLSGEKLDVSDFSVGAVLVISNEDWEASCLFSVLPDPSIDQDDDTLFFEIAAKPRLANGNLPLRLKRISGRHVAPMVDVDVHEKAVSQKALRKKFVFDKVALPITTRNMFAADQLTNVSLSKSVRPTFSHSARVNLGKIGHIDLRASLSANVKRFRFTRLKTLEFQWDQELDASFSGGVFLEGNHSPETRTGPIVRLYLPKLSFSANIIFIARIKAGAFVGLNWITEMDINAGASVEFEMKYRRKEAIKAQLNPPKYSARNLLAPSTGSGGKATLTFDDPKVSARFTGFVGVRPQIGLGIEYKKWSIFPKKRVKKNVDGNVGANIGLEAFAGIKQPPFDPYTGQGGKIGPCESCHSLRGSLAVKGKTLSAQLVVNNKVREELVFVQNLFEIPIGTICAIPQSCPAVTLPPIITNPGPPVPPSAVCRKCRLGRRCQKGLRCIRGLCRFPAGVDVCRGRPRVEAM